MVDVCDHRVIPLISSANMDIMITPFAWLDDGTYGPRPINKSYVALSSHVLFWVIDVYILNRLFKDVVTFTECGNRAFINPARFPPSRLYGSGSTSQTTTTYTLSHTGIPMGAAICISFGTVIDSHLFHPRIPKAAMHGVTIYPFKGEWPRSTGTFGHAFKEPAFLYYVHSNGITFTGGWGTPSSCFSSVPFNHCPKN